MNPAVGEATTLVAAGVVLESGRVLITRRRAGTHLAGKWEFPGGKVEAGEDPREALRRELHEELGIDAAVGEVVDVTFHRYEEVSKSVLLIFFEARRTRTSPEPQAIEVAELAWATETELDAAAFPAADRAALEKVRALLIGRTPA